MSINNPNESSKTILIVASDEKTSAPFKEWFEQAGFSVDIALDAIKAIEYVRENMYQLILIDCQLDEEFAGLDAYWLLKPYIPNNNVIMMSSVVDKRSINRVKSRGLHHLIHKSFEPDHTPYEIEKVLTDMEYSSSDRGSFHPIKNLFHRFFSNN
ncbi:MAG: response regulator [Candidatus Hinthialibacter sp.]